MSYAPLKGFFLVSPFLNFKNFLNFLARNVASFSYKDSPSKESVTSYCTTFKASDIFLDGGKDNLASRQLELEFYKKRNTPKS
jgi:hypothetical protein